MYLYFQGGFAKCYELIDVATNTTYAGKIVSKALLVKPHQKDKVSFYVLFCLFKMKKEKIFSFKE